MCSPLAVSGKIKKESQNRTEFLLPLRSLGSSKHVFKMASRRKEKGSTRAEKGRPTYKRPGLRKIASLFTADEWNVLRSRSVVRRRKSEVFEVEIILGERKRKVREFPLFLCTRCIKLISYNPVTYLFVYLVQEVREFLVKWSGWGSEALGTLFKPSNYQVINVHTY